MLRDNHRLMKIFLYLYIDLYYIVTFPIYITT